MDAIQRSRQMQACHAAFSKLKSQGDVPAAITIYDFARPIIGRSLLSKNTERARRKESLKELDDTELNALLDRLNGKENKMLTKLHDFAKGAGILDLAKWMREAAQKEDFAFLRGHTPDTLPLPAQHRLAQRLATWAGAKERKVNRESAQLTLF